MPKSSKKEAKREIHPDHTPELKRVRMIIGQMEGVEKMIKDRRYCPQILQQIKAATSAMNALKMEVLKRHLNECLAESVRAGDNEKLLKQVLEIFQMQISK